MEMNGESSRMWAVIAHSSLNSDYFSKKVRVSTLDKIREELIEDLFEKLIEKMIKDESVAAQGNLLKKIKKNMDEGICVWRRLIDSQNRFKIENEKDQNGNGNCELKMKKMKLIEKKNELEIKMDLCENKWRSKINSFNEINSKKIENLRKSIDNLTQLK